MPERCTYDYAVIRVVPRVEREEFVNVGVIVSCPALSLPRGADRARRAPRAGARSRGRPAGDPRAPRDDPADLRRRRRGRADRHSCRCASASTGSPPRGARSSRPLRCTPASWTIRVPRSSVCSTRWCACSRHGFATPCIAARPCAGAPARRLRQPPDQPADQAGRADHRLPVSDAPEVLQGLGEPGRPRVLGRRHAGGGLLVRGPRIPPAHRGGRTEGHQDSSAR